MPIEANYVSFTVNTSDEVIVEVDYSGDGEGRGITLIRGRKDNQ